MNKHKLIPIMGLVMALAVLAWGINPGWAVTPMPNPGGVPDYFATPNWAISPMPTVSVQGTPTLIGNALIPRQYATDYAAPPTVFVVVPGAVLPAGTLLNFQSLNQATACRCKPDALGAKHVQCLHSPSHRHCQPIYGCV
jgi:hypothetical protein